jgi:hypothetical protein
MGNVRGQKERYMYLPLSREITSGMGGNTEEISVVAFQDINGDDIAV